MSDKCILDPERDCIGLVKARELEREVDELRRQNSSSHERIFERLGELEKQEGIQGVQYENILEKLDQLAGDVKDLKAKPAKRWESVMEKILSTVVAAIMGFVLARLSL